jgi:hypothetical protein
VTRPTAKAGGFSLLALGASDELLARCPRELAGVRCRMASILGASKQTATVVRQDGLFLATRRTLDRVCGCTGLAATTHGVIARAHADNIVQVFDMSKRQGPFTLMPTGRGPPAPIW